MGRGARDSGCSVEKGSKMKDLIDHFLKAICRVGFVIGCLCYLCALTGCISTMFRDKVEIKRVDVERYDPNTGRPRKMCRIVDKREIEVEFVGEDGSTWTEKIRLEGGNWSPPALPEKTQ